jgi:NADPH-dependent ferric siderophore reductase
MTLALRRVRHEIRLRRLSLLRAHALTPRMRRLVLGGEDLAGFDSPGFDDHVKLFFPGLGGEVPAFERVEGEIRWAGERPEARDYTPRAFDSEAREITIDFVIHEGGVAAGWAAKAEPGDGLVMGGPRGSMLMEGPADWHLLLGDATALPAIARRLEELPAGTRAIVAVEVADAGEEQALRTQAELDLRWLHADRGETLLAHLDAVEVPAGEGFAFVGAEAGTATRAREVLPARGVDPERMRASNYWRRGTADDQTHSH